MKQPLIVREYISYYNGIQHSSVVVTNNGEVLYCPNNNLLDVGIIHNQPKDSWWPSFMKNSTLVGNVRFTDLWYMMDFVFSCECMKKDKIELGERIGATWPMGTELLSILKGNDMRLICEKGDWEQLPTDKCAREFVERVDNILREYTYLGRWKIEKKT